MIFYDYNDFIYKTNIYDLDTAILLRLGTLKNFNSKGKIHIIHFYLNIHCYTLLPLVK